MTLKYIEFVLSLALNCWENHNYFPLQIITVHFLHITYLNSYTFLHFGLHTYCNSNYNSNCVRALLKNQWSLRELAIGCNYLPVTSNAETATVTVTTTNNIGESYVFVGRTGESYVFVGRTGGTGDAAGVQIFLSQQCKTPVPVSKRSKMVQLNIH